MTQSLVSIAKAIYTCILQQFRFISGQDCFWFLGSTHRQWTGVAVGWSRGRGSCAARIAELPRSSVGSCCLSEERWTASPRSRSPARGPYRGDTAPLVAPLSSPGEEEAPPDAELSPSAPPDAAPVRPKKKIRGLRSIHLKFIISAQKYRSVYWKSTWAKSRENMIC